MKTVLRWVFRLVLAAVLLLLILGGFLYVKGSSAVSESFTVDSEAFQIPDDSASVAGGAYLSRTLGCVFCHGENLEGKIMADAPPFLAVASNLTPGGVGSHFTDQDWARAIRQGVGSDGRGLIIMPSEVFSNLSDLEVGRIIAYLKQVDAVENALPQTEIRTLGKLLAGAGALRSTALDVGKFGPRPTMPEFGATAEWGRYRAATICVACHGMDLRGAPSPDPDSPPGPDLVSVKGWTLAGFAMAMRNGITPGSRELDDKYMPWSAFQHMNDQEMEALYLALQEI
jgi:cytochrome c553